MAPTPWGTGARSPTFTNDWARRTANKKLTKLYWPSREHSPKRLIVLVEPKKWRGTTIIFPALCKSLNSSVNSAQGVEHSLRGQRPLYLPGYVTVSYDINRQLLGMICYVIRICQPSIRILDCSCGEKGRKAKAGFDVVYSKPYSASESWSQSWTCILVNSWGIVGEVELGRVRVH